jgi:hypothetical protein
VQGGYDQSLIAKKVVSGPVFDYDDSHRFYGIIIAMFFDDHNPPQRRIWLIKDGEISAWGSEGIRDIWR